MTVSKQQVETMATELEASGNLFYQLSQYFEKKFGGQEPRSPDVEHMSYADLYAQLGLAINQGNISDLSTKVEASIQQLQEYLTRQSSGSALHSSDTEYLQYLNKLKELPGAEIAGQYQVYSKFVESCHQVADSAPKPSSGM